MHTLYWRESTSAFVVELALERAGVAFERVHVDTKKGRNREPDFLAINPLGHIPVLRLPDGTVMAESTAQILHLAETYPAARLAPPVGHATRPLFLRWLLTLTTSVYEAELRVTYPARYTAAADGAPGVLAAAKAKQDALFAVLRDHLRPAPYALGATESILDAYLAMLTQWYGGRVGEDVWRAHRRLLRGDAVFDRVWRRYFGDAE